MRIKAFLEKLLGEGYPRPDNFTHDFWYRGKKYHYHAETEPHTHPDFEEDYWVVSFSYWNPEYLFVYYDENGDFQSIVPELRVKYRFRIKKRHGVIRKEHLDKFSNYAFWAKRFNNSEQKSIGDLACIFRFIK